MTMTRSNPYSTNTALLPHLFNRNRETSVSTEGDVLTVWAKSGQVVHTIRADEINEVNPRKLPPSANSPSRPSWDGNDTTSQVSGLREASDPKETTVTVPKIAENSKRINSEPA